jgi:beta-xylosidase
MHACAAVQVRSDSGVRPSSWSSYSPSSLDLGESAQGEIDAHVFRDDDGLTYLLWKTDDNSIGMKSTRLWGQQFLVNSTTVRLVGSKTQLLDSSGLWWVTSWVAGGTLIEGPELVKHGDYYYLFFAAGRYCQTSYVALAQT